jgi:hypothetical protein
VTKSRTLLRHWTCASVKNGDGGRRPSKSSRDGEGAEFGIRKPPFGRRDTWTTCVADGDVI